MYLIFDFDGVIANTKEASARSKMKIDGLTFEQAMASDLQYASHRPNHTRDHQLSPEELSTVYTWTRNFGAAMHEIDFSLFTEFVTIIESLATQYKAVVSSGSQIYIIPALAHTKINPTHILAYENHHSKEEKIELICADWGVSPSEVFYFTDTLADVYELRDLISEDKLIGVAWGYCGKEALLKELKPEYILDEPRDIFRVLPPFTDTQNSA